MGRTGMTGQLEALEDWAAGLLSQLQAASRNKLTRSIGQALRRSQQERIIAQRNPDGSRYAPRKQWNLRMKQGRIKRRRMFLKILMARFFKVHGNGDATSVGFTGRIARIARIHQFGLKEHNEHRGSRLKYEERQLLGLTNDDLNLIRDRLLSHVS
jgi:phage virion morphogenesis protein